MTLSSVAVDVNFPVIPDTSQSLEALPQLSNVIMMKFLWKSLGVGVVLVQYGCIAHCTLEFVGSFVVCSGPSMMPTINTSDIVLAEHISVKKKNISVGDVVIARSPTNPHQRICKRIGALEGDFIENPSPGYGRKYIPRGHVWLQGDNKDNSTDSRTYGPVPYALLLSKVLLKVYPFQDFGALPKPDTSNR